MSSSSTRALRVLDEVANSGRPLGVTEIARALSLTPGTVFRSLDALLRAGLVARYRASARYIPGPAAERLHRSVIARFPVREVCLPYLRQLVSISGETSSLHVRIGWYEVRICSVPGTGEVATMPAAGEAHALSESPAGQTILACLPKAELAAYRMWSDVKANTSTLRGGRKMRSIFRVGVDARPIARHANSGTNSRASQVERIAQRGFAIGRHDGVIALPIRIHDRAIAAITIDGFSRSPESGDQSAACKEVIANIEALATAQPSLFANPFAHLDPNSLRL